jgi:fatty-acid desaturase
MRHECDAERRCTSKEYLGTIMYDVTLENRVKGINWDTALFMGLFHLGAVAALFVFNWKAVLVAILLWWIAGSLGVGIGFHRLLTHRSYKTPKLVEYFLTI